MIEIFDSFVFNFCNLESLKHIYDNGIFSIKSEGGSYHVNQAYDILVAKNDKLLQSDSLGYPREINIRNRNIVNQWGLIHCELAAIRNITKHPEICRDYFTAFKININHNIPFQQWCNKIDTLMQEADPFNIFTKNKHLDKYKLLKFVFEQYIQI